MRRGAWLAAGLAAAAGLAFAVTILLSEAPVGPSLTESSSPTRGESRRVARRAAPAGKPASREQDAARSPGAEMTEPPSPSEQPLGPSVQKERPEGEAKSGEGSETLSGGTETRRGGSWLLDPEVHQEILEALPEEEQVPYLSVRLLKLATQTLREFPPEERASAVEARNRIAALRKRIAERKRETGGDPAAVEVLRTDLMRLDGEVEAWRERVLAGEPIVPEFVL